jgi:hypothetical protein
MIGVVCGLVMVPVVYLQVVVAATVPMIYTVFTGTFILGPVIAQAPHSSPRSSRGSPLRRSARGESLLWRR